MALSDFTKPYKDAFFEDLDALRIRRADHFPEATGPGHIARMIEMIAILIQRDCAYRAEDGSVYFRIRVVSELWSACAFQSGRTAIHRTGSQR